MITIIDISEKILVLLLKEKVNKSDLCSKIGLSRSAFYKKLRRNLFTTEDLEKIAGYVGYSVSITFEKKENAYEQSNKQSL